MSKRTAHFIRPEWSAIPICIEHEMAIFYELAFSQETTCPTVTAYKKLSEMYNAVHQIWKLEKNDEYEYNSSEAYRKTKSLIKRNANYENYVKLGDYILSRIKEDSRFYGFALYRFEMQHRFYALTSVVNKLLYSECDMERTIVAEKYYYLRNINFTYLRQFLDKICDIKSLCLFASQFQLLLYFVTISSVMVINGLIEKGYLGDDWYDFLLSVINKKAVNVLYSPGKIKCPNKPEAQNEFKYILLHEISHHEGLKELMRQLKRPLSKLKLYTFRNCKYRQVE